eukprot:160227-Rhodomonas_salina.1
MLASTIVARKRLVTTVEFTSQRKMRGTVRIGAVGRGPARRRRNTRPRCDITSPARVYFKRGRPRSAGKMASDAAFQEPELPNVHVEDRVVVRNVLYAAQSCLQGELQLDNWSITVTDKHYVVNIYLATGSDFDVNMRDMQTIADVNPLRVASVN